MRTQLKVALAVVLTLGSVGGAADWTRIKIAEMTEAEFLISFGPPDEVVVTFPWSEWSAQWKKRPVKAHYKLRYTQPSSKSSVLTGPGGKADSVEVEISGGRVRAVWWHYGGMPAREAAAAFRADPELTFGPREAASRAAKRVAGGALFVDLEGPYDSTVSVLLSLK